MKFHINNDKTTNSQDISKIGLRQNNLSIINKDYTINAIKSNNKQDDNQSGFKNKDNFLSINYKSSMNKFNLNNNNNQNKSSNIETFYCRKELENIKEQIRNRFVRKVYLILLVQFFLTFGLILICQIKIIKNYLSSNKVLYISLIVVSIIIFIFSFVILICFPSFLKKVPQNYIFLFLFTISETILIVYLSLFYCFECVLGAISFVISICGAIFFISCMQKISLKHIYISLIISLTLGVIYGLLVLIFRNYYLELCFCLLGAIVYMVILIFDTQRISQFDKGGLTIDDYIFAALMLYTDIIGMFIMILRILGSFYCGKGGGDK